MIKNDAWIKFFAQKGMINPFVPQQVREEQGRKVISYGLSSYGYDIRLSPKDFRVFRNRSGSVVDPKHFDAENLEIAQLHQDESGSYFILPSHSYGLGVAFEALNTPENVTVVCIGKSTYCRCGIIANLSPVEASWRGYLTLEFSNSSPADARIYANEGVVQLLFFEGELCEVDYEARQGKYQDQKEVVTFAKV